MPPVFFLSLFLPQFKLTLFFSLSLFPRAYLALEFSLLLLKFECFLCFRSNSSAVQLLVDFTLHPLGINTLVTNRTRFERWTKTKPGVVFEHKVIDLIVFGFGTKCDFTNLVSAVRLTLTNTYPKGLLKKYGQFYNSLLQDEILLKCSYKERTTKEAGY